MVLSCSEGTLVLGADAREHATDAVRAKPVGFGRDEGGIRGRVRHDAGGIPCWSSPGSRNWVRHVAHRDVSPVGWARRDGLVLVRAYGSRRRRGPAPPRSGQTDPFFVERKGHVAGRAARVPRHADPATEGVRTGHLGAGLVRRARGARRRGRVSSTGPGQHEVRRAKRVSRHARRQSPKRGEPHPSDGGGVPRRSRDPYARTKTQIHPARRHRRPQRLDARHVGLNSDCPG